MALDLPAVASAQLARWRDAATQGRAELRPVPEAQLHVTLLFLGNTQPAEVDALWEGVGAAAAGVQAPVLAPIGVKGVPPRRPRLFALDLADAGHRAGDLHQRLAQTLDRTEERTLWPHVTLARVRRGAHTRALTVPDAMPFESITVAAVTLYRSQPSAGGARYTPLRSLELVS